jgi:(4S)-4-hydroxy-5-phosphonooxypentane-2,3-dione isomerase
VIVARWRPRGGERDKIEAILRELVSEIRKEPGNLAFVAQRSNDDPYEFLLYEQYESEQAFRDHQQTPHFKRLVLERGAAVGAPGTAGVYDIGVRWPSVEAVLRDRSRAAGCPGPYRGSGRATTRGLR